MPEIGKTLGHYRIIQQLGRGGMGEVYLAEDRSLDRKVALKFLPDAFTGDPERMARFEREANLLASLNHPNIAAIYGLEQADGKRFLVLEYVEGETLQSRLSKGTLPLDESLGVCRQSAEGLEAAHEKGVIHRNLNSFESRLVEGSGSAEQPFFSPDGRWIAFFARGQLLKSEVAGGVPIGICDAVSPYGGTWREDDTIIYTAGISSGLLRILAGGGETESLTKPDGANLGYGHTWPQSLPGGHNILFNAWGRNEEIYGYAILSLDSNQWKLVQPGRLGGVFCLSSGTRGYLSYLDHAGGMRAALFDPEIPGLASTDTLVLTGVFFSENMARSYLAISENGTAVYAQGNPNKRSLAQVDHDGRTKLLVKDQQNYKAIALSPDGSRVLVDQGYEIWIYDVERPGSPSRITLPRIGINTSPIWSHDGSRIYFGSNRGGNWDIFTKTAEDSLPPIVLLERPYDQFPIATAPDGTVLFRELHPTTGSDIWALTPDGKVTQVLFEPFNEVLQQRSRGSFWEPQPA
jgi:hypothetical protein